MQNSEAFSSFLPLGLISAPARAIFGEFSPGVRSTGRGRALGRPTPSLHATLYRPFKLVGVALDDLAVDERGGFPRICPKPTSANTVITVSDAGGRPGSPGVIVANGLVDLNVCSSGDPHQCFPFYVYDEDGSNRRENITEWAWDEFRGHYRNPVISKWSIFDYVYGILHHPGYRAKFADNLKRELPRIPFAPDFRAFQQAGQKLIRLHLDYEKLEPWPLKWIETPGVPLSYRVEKMKLSKDKQTLVVNSSLTLGEIPPTASQYRLGNRSALEWVIDQYQVSEDKRSGIKSDPNREDDVQYIVRLVGQVVRVSVETMAVIAKLPEAFTTEVG